MRTKKIIKKKLKKPDEFITFSERAFHFIAQHSKSIAIGGGIVLALVLIIFLYQRWDGRNEGNASQMFRLAVESYRAVSSPYREESLQEYKTVAEKFDEVIAKFPGTSAGKIAILYKGNIYLRLSEFENAIKAYEDFLRKMGKGKLYRSFAMNGLGYSYEGKKEYEKAASAYQKVVDLGESFLLTDAYLGLGRCYEKLGKTKEAVENYKNFVKVSKKSEMTNMVLRKISVFEK